MLHPDGQFIRFGAKQMPGNADDVAHIQQLEQVEGALANGIELDVDLQAAAGSLNVREARLAVQTKRQNAAGGAHVDALGLEGGGVAARRRRPRISSRGRGLLEPVRIGIIAERFDFGELFLALEILIERLEGQGGFPFVTCGSIPMRFSERQGRAWA